LGTVLVAAALALAGCASRPSKAERFVGSAQHSVGDSVCTGLITLKVNNTYGGPVDLYARLSGGRDLFVGTLPAGRSEYTVDNSAQSFAILKPGTRERLEYGDYLPSGTPAMRRVYIERACAN
jgi:hypothetical protein